MFSNIYVALEDAYIIDGLESCPPTPIDEFTIFRFFMRYRFHGPTRFESLMTRAEAMKTLHVAQHVLLGMAR